MKLESVRNFFRKLVIIFASLLIIFALYAIIPFCNIGIFSYWIPMKYCLDSFHSRFALVHVSDNNYSALPIRIEDLKNKNIGLRNIVEIERSVEILHRKFNNNCLAGVEYGFPYQICSFLHTNATKTTRPTIWYNIQITKKFCSLGNLMTRYSGNITKLHDRGWHTKNSCVEITFWNNADIHFYANVLETDDAISKYSQKLNGLEAICAQHCAVVFEN